MAGKLKGSHIGLIIAGVIVAGYLIYMFWGSFSETKYVDKEIHVGFQGLAKHNSYLALQRLLEDYDEDVQSKARFNKESLPAYEDAMLFSAISSLPIDDENIDHLKDWIHGGGVLITGLDPEEALNVSTLPKKLKKLLSIQTLDSQDIEDEEPEEEEIEEEENNIIKIDEDIEIEEVVEEGLSEESEEEFEDDAFFKLFNRKKLNRSAAMYEVDYSQVKDLRRALSQFRDDKIRVDMDVRKYLKPKGSRANIVIDSRNDKQLFYYFRSARGWIFVLNDYTIFNNNYISDAHHATLATGLVQTFDPERIEILYQKSYSNLFTWLWQNGHLAMLSLILAIIAYIACVTKRFGPQFLPTKIGERRSVLEHIHAAGQILWKHKKQAWILKQVQSDIHDILRLRYTNWTKIDSDQQVKMLTKIVDVPEKEIKLAMNDQLEDVSQFTIIIQTLQSIRKQL